MRNCPLQRKQIMHAALEHILSTACFDQNSPNRTVGARNDFFDSSYRPPMCCCSSGLTQFSGSIEQALGPSLYEPDGPNSRLIPEGHQPRSPSPCDQVAFQSRHGITGDATSPLRMQSGFFTRLTAMMPSTHPLPLVDQTSRVPWLARDYRRCQTPH